MSNKNVNTEGEGNKEERNKSGVQLNSRPAERESMFEAGDQVKKSVTETGDDGKKRTYFKTFTIAASRLAKGHWEFQIKDPKTNLLHDSGKWFGESSLSDNWT
ncbi:hypothetical protein GQ44DRAFT_502589 [Phaeosphaeriaceae sp. PMI808]|nr:hypothetical protein GQ44DRAFT_502589 [Phaeosphaeriaceae sp. PMI808]